MPYLRDPPPPGGDPHVFFHLKLVAKVALGIGVLAATGFLLLVVSLKTEGFTSYEAIIASFQLSRHNLLPATLLTGLVLLTATAVVTWLIALYSSFRVAGPLFRFARNLERTIADGPARQLQPIRRNDELQKEAEALHLASGALAEQYATMQRLTAAIERELAKNGPDMEANVRRLIGELRETDAKVRL